MAQTVSGFYGQVDAPSEAGRLHRLSPPRIDKPGQFAITSTATRTIGIGLGTMLCCGIRLNETATVTTALPANSSGAIRYDVVGYRFTWSPTGGTVALFSKQGTSTTLPVLDRRPGIVYEFPLWGIIVRSGVTTISLADVYDIRPRGGFGGAPWQVDNNTFINMLDLPHGSLIQILGGALYQVSAVTASGPPISTALVSASTGPWTPYTPVLRAGGNAVNMGVGGTSIGRYQVKDGLCSAHFSLTPGNGNNMGTGQFSVDLPVAPTGNLEDTWATGYEGTTVGGTMLWNIKGLVRKSLGARVYLYAPTAGNDTRLLPAGGAIGGGPGLGIPYIADNYSVPANINMLVEYLI
jgi:hypothetical protein